MMNPVLINRILQEFVQRHSGLSSLCDLVSVAEKFTVPLDTGYRIQ